MVIVDGIKFESDAQYKLYLRVVRFFNYLRELYDEGVVFSVDGDIDAGVPFVDEEEIGFTKGNCKVIWVGCEHSQDPDTGEYDVLHVGTTLEELKTTIKVVQFIDIGEY